VDWLCSLCAVQQCTALCIGVHEMAHDAPAYVCAVIPPSTCRWTPSMFWTQNLSRPCRIEQLSCLCWHQGWVISGFGTPE
jgi:hypothetical protein